MGWITVVFLIIITVIPLGEIDCFYLDIDGTLPVDNRRISNRFWYDRNVFTKAKPLLPKFHKCDQGPHDRYTVAVLKMKARRFQLWNPWFLNERFFWSTLLFGPEAHRWAQPLITHEADPTFIPMNFAFLYWFFMCFVIYTPMPFVTYILGCIFTWFFSTIWSYISFQPIRRLIRHLAIEHELMIRRRFAFFRLVMDTDVRRPPKSKYRLYWMWRNWSLEEIPTELEEDKIDPLYPYIRSKDSSSRSDGDYSNWNEELYLTPEEIEAREELKREAERLRLLNIERDRIATIEAWKSIPKSKQLALHYDLAYAEDEDIIEWQDEQIAWLEVELEKEEKEKKERRLAAHKVKRDAHQKRFPWLYPAEEEEYDPDKDEWEYFVPVDPNLPERERFEAELFQLDGEYISERMKKRLPLELGLNMDVREMLRKERAAHKSALKKIQRAKARRRLVAMALALKKKIEKQKMLKEQLAKEKREMLKELGKPLPGKKESKQEVGKKESKQDVGKKGSKQDVGKKRGKQEVGFDKHLISKKSLKKSMKRKTTKSPWASPEVQAIMRATKAPPAGSKALRKYFKYDGGFKLTRRGRIRLATKIARQNKAKKQAVIDKAAAKKHAQDRAEYRAKAIRAWEMNKTVEEMERDNPPKPQSGSPPIGGPPKSFDPTNPGPRLTKAREKPIKRDPIAERKKKQEIEKQKKKEAKAKKKEEKREAKRKRKEEEKKKQEEKADLERRRKEARERLEERKRREDNDKKRREEHEKRLKGRR